MNTRRKPTADRFWRVVLVPTYITYCIISRYVKRNPLYQTNWSYDKWCAAANLHVRLGGLLATFFFFHAIAMIVVLVRICFSDKLLTMSF